jgi:hypothetical protein
MTKHPLLNRLMTLAIGVAVFSSCGTLSVYDGPKKDRSEVATLIVISAHNSLFTKSAYVTNVDDSLSFPGKASMRDAIELLPGHHEIVVGHGGSYQTCALSFEAEAGKTYAVIAKEVYNEWSAFLAPVDQRTNLTSTTPFRPHVDINCRFGH